MNKAQYLARLADLLASQYAEFKAYQKQPESHGARVEGFLEAGLVAELVTQKE